MRSLVLAALFTTLSVTLAISAHAQPWRLQPRVQREIQSDINDLERQISRAADRRAISPRDARELRRDAAKLRQTFHRFSRDGLDRREVEQLESQVNRLRLRLRLERRDWARHR